MKKPIAKDWNEMPLRLWQEEQEILKDQETDAVDKNVRLVALMYDMSEDEAYNTELNEFSNMLDGIGWLGKNPDVPGVAPAYNLNGTTYIVTLNPQKITTAQYIDYKSFNPGRTGICGSVAPCDRCCGRKPGRAYRSGGKAD